MRCIAPYYSAPAFYRRDSFRGVPVDWGVCAGQPYRPPSRSGRYEGTSIRMILKVVEILRVSEEDWRHDLLGHTPGHRRPVPRGAPTESRSGVGGDLPRVPHDHPRCSRCLINTWWKNSVFS